MALDVIEIAPTLAQQADDGAQLLGEAMGDAVGVTGIVQAVGEEVVEAGAFKDLPHQHQAAIATLVGLASLDDDGAVERSPKAFYRFTHGVSPFFCFHGLDTTDYKGKGIRAIPMSGYRRELRGVTDRPPLFINGERLTP